MDEEPTSGPGDRPPQPRWWYRPLLQWVLSYPVLVTEALALVLVCWYVLLAPFGIPDLFWDDAWGLQIWSGLGVGLLALDLGLVGFLLDNEQPWYRALAPRGGSGEVRHRRALVRYLCVTTLPIVALCVLGLVKVPTQAEGGVPLPSRPLWPLPVAAAVFATGLGLLATRALGELSDEPRFVPRHVRDAISSLPRREWRQHLSAYYYFVLRVLVFLVFLVIYGTSETRPSVPLLLCLVLGNVALAYGYLKRFHRGRTFGILAAAALAYVALNFPGGHQVPDLDYCELNLVEVGKIGNRPAARPLITDEQALEAWERSRRATGPLVVVAVDGGGIRAAVWAATVLTKLEEALPGFLHQVRIVTGASGGMVGSGAVIASLQPPASSVPAAARYANTPWASRQGSTVTLGRDQLLEAVAEESLSPVGRTLVFLDLLVPPWLHPRRDRGLALERAWEGEVRPLAMSFAELAEGERKGWRPSLIVTPVIVEDGRRLFVTNLDAKVLTHTPLPGLESGANVEGIEFFKVFNDADRLRLSTALRWNATFPYVTPAAELPTRPVRRVVDAGYLDEHGVELAGRWLWAHQDWISTHTDGVLLVEVPDSRAIQGKQTVQGKPRSWWKRGSEGLSGPIEAFGTSRDAATSYRNDHLVAMVEQSFRPKGEGFFCRVVFEPDPRTLPRSWWDRWRRPARDDKISADPPPAQDVALSWRLSESEKKALTGPAIDGEGNRKRMAELAAWWRARTTGDCANDPACRCQGLAARAAAMAAE